MIGRVAILPVDERLRASSRLPTSSRESVRAVEWIALAGAGATATLLTSLIDFRLGIPGHNIVFAIFPIALGLALVPRRGAGSTMAAAAVLSAGALALGGVRVAGVGALTSLFLAGPMLDLAVRRGGSGWRLYAAFVVAGAATNTVAFAARAAAKMLGIPGMGGGRALAAWLPQAVWTYALAGIAAGLISAAAWFQLRGRADRMRAR